jgi:gluconate 5-dehydrogenase
VSGSFCSLEGKLALVTGASRGIGRAIAQELASAGASVVVGYRSGAEEAEALAAEIGGRAVQADVSQAEDAARLVEEAGDLDILVNNAGVQRRSPLEDFPAEDFEALLQSNVASVFHVGQACARHMIKRGAGRIINIASVNASLARYSIAPYTATKGAVANLTKGMATDWARHGLNCNAIAPGYMRTPLNQPLWSDPAFNDWLTKRTPAQRWGEPEELVGACVFLASDASSFVNGHVLYVDGGLTASL